MRIILASGLLASFALWPLACGGGKGATDGAKAPDTTPLAAASAPPADTGPTTTTTTTLGDGGDLQGAKLSETHTVASTTAPASSAPKGPHGHDPGRSPDDIRVIIQAHRDEARACYDKALKDHPGIEGDIVVQWTIDPKGNVTAVTLDTARSKITEPTVLACISDVIKRIKFSESPGGYETKANYPFNFHPKHGQN